MRLRVTYVVKRFSCFTVLARIDTKLNKRSLINKWSAMPKVHRKTRRLRPLSTSDSTDLGRHNAAVKCHQ